MSDPRRILRRLGVGADIGLTVVLQVVGSVAALFLQMAFLRALSKEESGLYFLAISYITIGAGLADFGIVAAVFPRLAVARGEITPAFKAALLLRIATIGASLLVLNIYMVIFAKWDLIVLVNIGFISVIISSKATGLRQIFEVIWRFRGRTYVVTILSVADAVLSLAAVLVLAVRHELTILWLIVIYTFGNLPGCILVMLPLLRSLRASDVWRVRIPRRYYKALISAALPVAAMIVLGQTSAQLETLVIENYAGTTEQPLLHTAAAMLPGAYPVQIDRFAAEYHAAMTKASIAAYNAAVRPVLALLFVATTLGFGLAPLVSQRMRGLRSDYSLEFIASMGLRIIGAISLAICLVCGLFSEDIMRLFGGQYAEEAYILRIYSGISALVFTAVVFDQFLLALGKRKQALTGAALNLGIALLSEPISIGLWGIRGMMYSKAFALCCLLAFQLSRLHPEVRAAARTALFRLAPSAAVLAIALYVSTPLALPLRVLCTTASFLIALVAMRTVGWEELRTLRALRVA